jgi:DNA-binding response OmpR family regulator
LVVEDDPHARELFRTTLLQAGYGVVAVEDGFDALLFLETHVPAAVVLDLGLVRVSGLDVFREMRVRGISGHVPVIVVTGAVPPGIEHEGFACILGKPIAPDDLVETVRRCIRAAGR